MIIYRTISSSCRWKCFWRISKRRGKWKTRVQREKYYSITRKKAEPLRYDTRVGCLYFITIILFFQINIANLVIYEKSILLFNINSFSLDPLLLYYYLSKKLLYYYLSILWLLFFEISRKLYKLEYLQFSVLRVALHLH